MPSSEEISRLRAHISRVTAGLDDLTAAERAEIDQAVAVVRRHRTVMLGMPRTPPPPPWPAPPPAAARNDRHERAPSGRARRCPVAAMAAGGALPRASASASSRRWKPRRGPAKRSACRRSPAGPGWTAPSSTGTATCWPRSTPARPRRPPGRQPGPPLPGPRCKPTCSPPTSAPPAWPPASASLSTAYLTLSASRPARVRPRQPDDIGQLKQQVTHLAEENQQLRGGLAERDQDLAAARAASRELMPASIRAADCRCGATDICCGHSEPGGSGWVWVVPVPSVSARLKAAWVSSARVRGLLPRLLAVW